MSFEVVFPSAVSAIALIVVAVIENHATKSRKKMEERAIKRAEESQLAMGLMSATCSLSIATATAIKAGHVDGIMDAALEQAREAQAEYNDFLQKTAATAVSKI